MLKKLLSLAAVAAVCVSAQAKEVVDREIDWTTTTWNNYVMGYIPQTSAEEGLIFEWPNFNYVKVEDDGANPDGYDVVKINGEDHYVVPTEDGGPRDEWGIQAHISNGNFDTQVGVAYSVTIVAKSSKDGATLGLPLSWGWGSGEGVSGSVAIGTEWAEYTVNYDEVGGSPCWIVAQMYSGDNDARICVKSIKIFHNEKDGPAVETEWKDWLVNGDAEGEYGDVPCAYSKEYKGRDAANNNAEIAQPEPSEIISMDGSKVFVCRAKKVDTSAYPDFFQEADGSDKGDAQWQNQFWIQSPKAWAEGDQIRISFKYKADKPAAADTQAHGETPGGFLHWEMIGSVNFTTEWQEFSKTITINANQKGAWSVAFNLKEYADDNNYYFDDLKWETMVLDEGWFIAGDFNDWDLAGAIEMKWDEENAAYGTVVGTDDKPASSVKISTVRGNDNAFNAATIKAVGELEDGGDWVEYKAAAAVKIALPEAGIWYIGVDPENGQIGIESRDENGIEDVISENAPAVYYNLQGVQVVRPQAGNVYIVKRGTKVSKAYIR